MIVSQEKARLPVGFANVSVAQCVHTKQECWNEVDQQCRLGTFANHILSPTHVRETDEGLLFPRTAPRTTLTHTLTCRSDIAR
jgi:hypothetical protein